ncbi:MAG TPA: hypothetical protein VFP15_01375 [Gemmatimonadaceae bacterium]|nr:hypothetical protein [Gemmatimonadaceae bacterium]
MTSAGITGRRIARITAGSLTLAAGALLASCASSTGGSMSSAPGTYSGVVEPTPLPPIPTAASTTDPRVGLKAGLTDAGWAANGLRLVGHVNKSDALTGEGGARGLVFANSDLAFRGNLVFQGNFSGFQIWDISNPAAPTLKKAVVCATGQGDPSIYGNLLFLSSESTGNRTDCGTQGIQDRVSKDRMVGVRIYDVSDISNPRKVMDIQTCRGSHTHTLVPDANDPGVVYIYVSGSAGVRSGEELAGCVDAPIDSANTSRFRVEVIKVPLAHPEQAQVVNYAHIFNDLGAPGAHGAAPSDAPPRQRPAGMGPRTGPNQCHDITVYPAIGLAGGACGGYGLLLDIRDPVNPKRIQAVGDTNFAFWHSATFNNDGSKVLFTDEWGGGTLPKCRADDPIDWGGDAIFTLSNDHLTQGAYFKMPAAQTKYENCVAHNGSLVPIPGRDVMVQGWYQGGLDVIDFTDARHPYEVAYFDRGPVDATKLVTAGYWAGYWYNGHIYGSEIARGLDVFKLVPTDDLTQNEIDAANLVRFSQLNPQSQPHVTWPAAFVVARAYVDQLERGNGLSAERVSAISAALKSAESKRGSARASALRTLAASLDSDVASSSDAARVKALADVVRRIR